MLRKHKAKASLDSKNQPKFCFLKWRVKEKHSPPCDTVPSLALSWGTHKHLNPWWYSSSLWTWPQVCKCYFSPAVPTFRTCQQSAASPERREVGKLTLQAPRSQVCWMFENIPRLACLKHRQLSGGIVQGHRSFSGLPPCYSLVVGRWRTCKKLQGIQFLQHKGCTVTQNQYILWGWLLSGLCIAV